MTRRGYFERQGGTLRARLALPGYDVDDPNLSPNKIAFDSEAFGTLSVLRSGMGTLPSLAAFRAGHWVASGWDLPYVPLCTILFGYVGHPTIAWTPNFPFADYYNILRVTNDGIWIKQSVPAFIPAGSFPLDVKYIAYRLPV